MGAYLPVSRVDMAAGSGSLLLQSPVRAWHVQGQDQRPGPVCRSGQGIRRISSDDKPGELGRARAENGAATKVPDP